ncbi:hypothetical protein [Candidatus Manganitrophus noduliformans]|uniref:DUF932 domain-containing protein n=1 Tax=Candidatus Manganitrophus noduliformans TaxID=2606439 RepID=A0A7X6ICX8_9BACT|nr:hypothetical protein [Candidatus Manganitrophus noduliformans]NKE72879.1 hypothetical protein [Candidatus Manganitrophus noduliformans]
MQQIQSEMAVASWSGRGSLTDLVGELERQKESKFDFVSDTRGIAVAEREGKLFLIPKEDRATEWIPALGLPIRPGALDQMGEKCDPQVPIKFLRELSGRRPRRAAELLNNLIEDAPARRFIRCLDGSIRAFLSDRYRVLDNYDLAFAALDAVRLAGGEVIEASLSETHMRIKFTSRQIWDAIDIRRQDNRGSWYAGGLGNQGYLSRVSARSGGDLPGGPGTVHPLVTLSNSETGHGGLSVRIGLLQAICFNLATVEEVVAKVHLGERLSVGVFTEETVTAESKAIYLKARDTIKGAFDPLAFKRMVDLAKEAQAQEIHAPAAAVENVAKAASLPEKAKDALLAYFVKDYDLTRYGLAQAVARLAQDEEDGESGAGLEDLAGKILRREMAFA